MKRTWNRVANGLYTWADYTIRREPTTFGMGRASNEQWFVYQDGAERKIARRSTLQEAKAFVASHSDRRMQ